jgi:hypothetical protein
LSDSLVPNPVQADTQPFYNPVDYLPPGIVLQRDIQDGLNAAWVANGYQPLTPEQILAVTGPAPVFPTTLPRYIDSNPDPGSMA